MQMKETHNLAADIQLDLLDLIGSEPAFDTLRTKEQLGVCGDACHDGDDEC
jgi:secreted Zn-dependent insulinase-like peptidase